MADVELLRAENKRLANALQSLLRYVERCREAGVLVCDDIGPEEFARYELEQALSVPPEQPAAVDEAVAIRAFEEHFQASSDDPYFEGELELWLTAWRKALATQQQEVPRG